jgi:4-hydroxybenzoate polyprenyltransferase
MKDMLAKVITLGTLIAATLLATIFTSVSLSSSSVGIILAVFFLLYVVLVGAMAWGGYVLNRLVVRFSQGITLRKPAQRISLQHAYYLSSVLALGPIILLGMNTVAKVGIYDIILVLLFVSIGLFYVQKRVN